VKSCAFPPLSCSLLREPLFHLCSRFRLSFLWLKAVNPHACWCSFFRPFQRECFFVRPEAFHLIGKTSQRPLTFSGFSPPLRTRSLG